MNRQAADPAFKATAMLTLPGMGSDHCAGIARTRPGRPGAIATGGSLPVEQENLFRARFRNLAAIPVAAFGLPHPMSGILATTAGSLSVIGNSLLLTRTRLAVAPVATSHERTNR